MLSLPTNPWGKGVTVVEAVAPRAIPATDIIQELAQRMDQWVRGTSLKP